MRMAFSLRIAIPLLLFAGAALAADGGTLKVELPEGTKVKSAVAVDPMLKKEIAGAVSGTTVTFDKVLAETTYDVRLTLADGTTVQGVNLDWYDEEDAKPDAGALNDEDRDEILKITSIDPFYSKHDIIALNGNHDRASVLVQLVRDKDFYAGAGQVIWRVEIYYFKNQHGGWEKIGQQNKIIRRERFKTHDAYTNTVSKIKFLGTLGGLKLAKDETSKTVKIETFEAVK